MRAVAGGTALLDCIMSENEGTHLGLVALGTALVLAVELRATTLDGAALVGVVAVGAGHLPIEHRVSVRQHEVGLLVEVALEAGGRVPMGIDDRASRSAGFDVLAAGTVAGLATHVRCLVALGLEAGVICGPEVAGDLVVTLITAIRAQEGGAGDKRGRHHRAAGGGAGDEDECGGCTAAQNPEQISGLVAIPTAGQGSQGCFPEVSHKCWLVAG